MNRTLRSGAAALLLTLAGHALAADGPLPPSPWGPDDTLVFPVHVELLAKNGIYILESMVTKDLAADAAYEFLFVLGQPRFEGAVQAIINPIGIR